MASPSFSKTEADYRAESDHSTLSHAQEIQQDPARMKGVRKHHRKISRAHRALSKSLQKGGR